MSDDINDPEGPGADDVLAAELSLGLLVGEEGERAMRRSRTDPAFAVMVADWDMRFALMCDAIEPVTPPKGTFAKIAARAYPDESKGFWSRFTGLPALFGAGIAAAVIIFAVQFGGLLEDQNEPSPAFIAQLASEDQSLVVAAAYLDEEGVLVVDRQVGASAPDRALQLWLIAGADAPVSLGLLSPDQAINEVIIPEALRDRIPGATLAISDEPLGGSPTGAPTGAVLAAGEITSI